MLYLGVAINQRNTLAESPLGGSMTKNKVSIDSGKARKWLVDEAKGFDRPTVFLNTPSVGDCHIVLPGLDWQPFSVEAVGSDGI